MSYDNAKACAVVETTDLSQNMINVDTKSNEIQTDNNNNRIMYSNKNQNEADELHGKSFFCLLERSRAGAEREQNENMPIFIVIYKYLSVFPIVVRLFISVENVINLKPYC